MKLSEDILKGFDVTPIEQREPVNIMKVSAVLAFLKESAERIEQKSELYIKTADANVQADCIDIVTAKLNDFTQAFRDLVIFIRKTEHTHHGNESLRYCITSYDAIEHQQTELEQAFLRELLLRNEITHDYFNREIHLQKLIGLMTHYSGGAVDIYNHLYQYCEKNDWLEKYVDKG